MVGFLSNYSIEDILKKLELFLFCRNVRRYKFTLRGCTLYTAVFTKKRFFGGKELKEQLSYRQRAIAKQCNLDYEKIKIIRIKL